MSQQTVLNATHRAAGARMVDFGGWDMPIHYGSQVDEHHQVRRDVGMFDVSHMTVIDLHGPRTRDFLRHLLANSIDKLKVPGKALYSCMLNEKGGVIDDLIVYYLAEDFFRIVSNASTRDKDLAWIEPVAASFDVRVVERPELALIAVQGPNARVAVLAQVAEADRAAVAALGKFAAIDVKGSQGEALFVARTGYTGEDGFEISVPADQAEHLARHILEQPDVAPVGLGARDSLRLEAGLCLYGSDIDTTTTPVEGALVWAMQKRRRDEGGFPGAAVIQRQLAEGTARLRVGILPEGKAPARAHTEIQDDSGRRIGEITSGGFGPTVGGPVAMGTVETAFAEPGTAVTLLVRGKPQPARVVALPFVEQRYYRG